jgi:sugar phosphate isomerase/epimerase
MRCGLFTDALAHLSLAETVAWCAARGIHDLEFGVGGYSAAPHLALGSLLADPEARRAFVQAIEGSGSRISALNASGNPLHPDASTARSHDAGLRDAVILAGHLGVERVVAMSGCPGHGQWPVFAGGAWLPDLEGLWQEQWEQIAAYWSELSAWAEREVSGVSILLELHPGTSIYNPASFALLRSVVGANVGVNFDPSHFWWQGIDPVRAAAELADHVGFAHGKDTLLRPELIARNGVLDFAWPERAPTDLPWHFCAIGTGHNHAEWTSLLETIAAGGYDDVISIEHEDPRLGPEEGIETSLHALQQLLAGDASNR